MSDDPANITQLLHAAASGDPRDNERLMLVIYEDLKRLAASRLKRERPGHTLHPTALVHEAYLRLTSQRTAQWNDRIHFFSIASRIIRRILIDHARERNSLKRGGAQKPLSIGNLDVASGERDLDLVALDEALGELAELSPRQAQIVELRFFGGLTIQEIAGSLSIGTRSVDRDWRIARAWLFQRLAEPGVEHDNAPGA